MKMRQLICLLCACTFLLGSSTTYAEAAYIPTTNPIWLEDMEWDIVDPLSIELSTGEAIPLSTESINTAISPFAVGSLGKINLQSNSVLTFNCSYSPSSASMDFGVIAPNGRFYYVNVKEGSINQAIRISQSGSYTMAVRNNSSQTVRVVGFVNY